MGRIIDHAVAPVVEGAGRFRRRRAGDRGVERLRRRPDAARCQGQRRRSERDGAARRKRWSPTFAEPPLFRQWWVRFATALTWALPTGGQPVGCLAMASSRKAGSVLVVASLVATASEI